MPSPAAPLEGVRAIGRPETDGPWIGFGTRGSAYRLVVGHGAQLEDQPAEADLLLAMAVAYFAEALDEAPPDLEATQSDLSALVHHLMNGEADDERRQLLSEALDAIDDGLAGDAVAGRLAAARYGRSEPADPVELLVARANELMRGR